MRRDGEIDAGFLPPSADGRPRPRMGLEGAEAVRREGDAAALTQEDGMAKTWLEVALSGPWTRKNQPRIPITVEEIVADGIAAAHEGAAIIHVHPYDPETGRQKDDADI